MEAILFDFGGTLDFPQHWLDRFLVHYRAAGIDLDRETLDPAFDNATRIAYSETADLCDFGLTQLVDYLLELQIGHLRAEGPSAISDSFANIARLGELDRLRLRIGEAFVAESRRGFSVSRPLLEDLSRRFRIGVVSNFYGNLERILSEAGIASSVSATIDSGRVGLYKPDLAIYTAALTALGVRPQETVMVGDSLDKDCAPARELGMRTVWLRHREFAKSETSAKVANFTIDRIEELQDLSWLGG